MSGKSMIPVIHNNPEKNYVTVEYDGITKTKDSRELYDKYEVGDDIAVEYIKGYNKNGELKSRAIDF